MQIKLSFIKEPLKLPKRYEILERQLKETGGEISRIVKRIDSACEHIEELLGIVNVGGTGQFQMFLGESGSGKTTFLRTLPNFFSNIHTQVFSKTQSFDQMLEMIESSNNIKDFRVFIIDERDNPKINEDELTEFFENLRVLFRKQEGQVLLIWPITKTSAAEIIGKIAWEVGKESISPNTGPIFQFKGLPKNSYFEVADSTIRNLNNGESLDSFGITEQISTVLLTKCNTIGEYYSQIEKMALDINEKKWKILEEKVKPKIWILLLGDSSTELDRTVKSLTAGIDSKIDIDRMCSFLDDKSNNSAYLNDWRRRRSDAGFLFRFLDVRLFNVSPNLALSTIRVFGTDSDKEHLNKKSDAKNICIDSVKRSDFFLALTNKTDTSKKSVKATNSDTQHEFMRLQQVAKSKDKSLNQAFSKALDETLRDEKITNYTIKCEKQELKGTNLKPDVLIELSSNEVICLEMTWRSTGTMVPGELDKKQNTLSTGHIQKYILEKIMEYVKELNI